MMPCARRNAQAPVAKVRRRLDAIGIPTMDNPSHIIPVMAGDPHHCETLTDWLLGSHCIDVQPYPGRGLCAAAGPDPATAS